MAVAAAKEQRAVAAVVVAADTAAVLGHRSLVEGHHTVVFLAV